MQDAKNTDHEDERAAGELGTPMDSEREWDGFDVSPNLSFIDDVLTPLWRLKRFTISCRKSRNSTAYSKKTQSNIKVHVTDVKCSIRFTFVRSVIQTVGLNMCLIQC